MKVEADMQIETRKYLQLSLDQAVEAIKFGKLIFYPTETFYALGGDALNSHAVQKVFVAKKRDISKPLPVIIGERATLNTIIKKNNLLDNHLIKQFWPGPLSILFKANDTLPKELTAGTGKIVVRYSSNEDASILCRAAQTAIISSSANLSGYAAVTHPDNIAPELWQHVAGMYLGNSIPLGGLPSTIIESVEGEMSVRILREGAISISSLKKLGIHVKNEKELFYDS